MSTFKARKAPKNTQAPGKPERPDPYQLVTDLIIGHLEKGVVPWRCPWSREAGRPRNFHSGKAYRGVNAVLLGCRLAASPWWMTYRQALERGGQVRRGESGAMVVKYGTFEREENETEGGTRKGMFLRTFTVFHASQIDGIAFPQPSPDEPLSPERRNLKAAAIAEAMPQRPVILEGAGPRACYSPASDEVRMPPFAAFETPESFYGTLYHELAHASGHPSRLNRPSLTSHDGFGGKVHSQEELVAEMCAAFLCMEADIVRDRHERSAAYLEGWLRVLKAVDHRRWLVQAAGHAARAADFILGKTGKPDGVPAEMEENPDPDCGNDG
ncbi:MAG: zincin-like metallopeptidase domain-containing protein [Verrucomicrobiota bacterium]